MVDPAMLKYDSHQMYTHTETRHPQTEILDQVIRFCEKTM